MLTICYFTNPYKLIQIQLDTLNLLLAYCIDGVEVPRVSEGNMTGRLSHRQTYSGRIRFRMADTPKTRRHSSVVNKTTLCPRNHQLWEG